jgi:hypothetical protein
VLFLNSYVGQPARAPNLRANFCQRLVTGHPPSHKASIFATSSAQASAYARLRRDEPASQESYDVTRLQ